MNTITLARIAINCNAWRGDHYDGILLLMESTHGMTDAAGVVLPLAWLYVRLNLWVTTQH